MEENKQILPAERLKSISPERVNKQMIKALFNTETIRYNYHKMLQGLQGTIITPKNLKESYPEIKEADKFLKALDVWRKDSTKPFNQVDADFLEVYKEIAKPILEALTLLKVQIKTASEINAAIIAKAKKEQERVDLIVSTLGNFINKITADITLATTDKEIGIIQMRIGSEKSRTSFYDTYIDELREKCDNLNPIINSQKEKIKQLQQFNSKLQEATDSGNDTEAITIKEKIEDLNYVIQENVIRLQEQAFTQSLNITQTEVGQPEINTVKGRVHRWKWKVENIDLLRKKNPELIKIVPNDEAIEELLKQKRNDGEFKELDSIQMNGILFYKEKYL